MIEYNVEDRLYYARVCSAREYLKSECVYVNL